MCGESKKFWTYFIFILFFILSFMVTPVFAETTVLPWQAIGWGGGGWVSVVRIDPNNPDVMYAATDMGGIYRSRDGGNHWQMINHPQKSGRATTDLLISRHSETIYVASNIGLLRGRKINEVFHWDLLSSEIRNFYGLRGYPMAEADLSNFVRSIAEHPTDPNILYVISATGGVYKTIDAGESFIQVNQGLPQDADGYVRSIAINPYNPNVLLVGTNNAGLYRTDNGGSSWSRVGAGTISDLKIADVVFSEDLSNTVFCLGRYGGFYKSTDGGITWLASNQGINLPVITGGGFINIALDPSNPSNLYIGAKSKNARPYPIYRSTDGGASWRVLAWWPIIYPDNCPYQSVNSFGEATNIAVHPTNSNIIYATYNWGILKSENATAPYIPGNDYVEVGPWYPKYDGLFVATSWSNGVHSLSNGNIFVNGGDDTFHLTDNEGLTWTQIRTANMVHGQSMGAVSYPAEPNRLYAVLGLPHTPSVDKASVYRTTDGGLSWPSIAPTNIQLGDIIRSIAGHPNDVNTLYIGVIGSLSSRGVYKTTNAAAVLPSSVTWQKKLDGDIFEVTVDPTNPDHILAASYNFAGQTTTLYRSIDAAQSWEPVLVNAFGNEPEAIVFSQTDSNVVFLVTAWCLYRSSNNGQTWTDIRYPAPIYDRLFTDLVSHPTVPGLVFLGGQAGPVVLQSTGVWMSYDNGDTWMLASDGLLFPAVVSLNISGDGNALYAMTSGASLWKATIQIQAAVNQPPSVDILTPNPGETISGPGVHFAADANDMDGTIARVEFYVDNVLKYTATARYYLSGVYSYWVDTTAYVNGNYTLKVLAVDNEEAEASHEIKVTINNPLPNQAPTVNILTPSMGEEISGIGTHFAANASDDNRVARVEFYVDGVLKHTAYERFYLSGVYSYWVDTTTYPNGKHTLKATALDDEGLEASQEIVVIINNPSLNDTDSIPLPSLPSDSDPALQVETDVSLTKPSLQTSQKPTQPTAEYETTTQVSTTVVNLTKPKADTSFVTKSGHLDYLITQQKEFE